jgi:hypothetical protein
MTVTGFGSRAPRLAVLVGLTALVVSSAVVAAPAALAGRAHATPAVTQIQLSSGTTKVMSSTHRKLQVDLLANNNPGSTADDVVITLREGGVAGEEHDWTFPVAASALKANPAGKGTLKVPGTKIAPYGVVSLTITPIGKPKTDSCNGTPADKVQKVTLAGTFFFDTKSTGSKRWGTVGSRNTKKKFAFSSTNDLTWFYRSAAVPDGGERVTGAKADCGGDNPFLPCSAGLIWDDASGIVDVSGVATSGVELIEASRNVALNTPVGATREDDLTGAGPAPQFTTTPDAAADGESNATLVATADTGASGTTTLTSVTPSMVQEVPCRGGTANETANALFWANATYTNGTIPLTVTAEIFGPITQANNTDATIIDIAP